MELMERTSLEICIRFPALYSSRHFTILRLGHLIATAFFEPALIMQLYHAYDLLRVTNKKTIFEANVKISSGCDY